MNQRVPVVRGDVGGGGAGNRVGVAIKGWQKGHLGGGGTAPYLDCSGSNRSTRLIK